MFIILMLCYVYVYNCYVYDPIPYPCASRFIGHQTITIMNHCCYYSHGPWEVKAPVYYYHVTYAFQSEYTLCSSLNFKERLPQNRCDI